MKMYIQRLFKYLKSCFILRGQIWKKSFIMFLHYSRISATNDVSFQTFLRITDNSKYMLHKLPMTGFEPWA